MRLQPSQDVALGISEGAFGQAVYLPELTELVIYYNTSQLGMKTHFVCKRKDVPLADSFQGLYKILKYAQETGLQF
ncbi:hypothetical protein PVAP13_3NG311306 [Panicum virgatum]|uniref:Uncharacterized protein n=1 Tax=Panicum virgatum TaxID=38727 RepID=A0A8T0UIG9_PANVG|nr:hypothetical protein PVAP13_3NG311306 [Panicum virgatum]